MSDVTPIQWCDTAVNPIMGCNGCELFPSPEEVLGRIDGAISQTGITLDSRAIFQELVNDAFQRIAEPKEGHIKAVNVTNIWHLREKFAEVIASEYGDKAAKAGLESIATTVTCYAAKQHLNRGANILKEGHTPHKGHAPIFEKVTQFPGRMKKIAKLTDLLGRADLSAPWKCRLPRMVFVSDMGDAFSAKKDFEFLKEEAVSAFNSKEGKRHLWLWLTKRPETMAEFSKEIGGFPENVCAMTTVTSADLEVLKRIDQLRDVKASIKGLSIEPLWERIPPEQLDLTGIDWVIVGGESGSGELTRPFAVEWSEELRDYCKKLGVAFFLKQLGRNPTRGGKPFDPGDSHGGDWNKWDESLKIREFPKAFHDYRAKDMTEQDTPRTSAKLKKSATKEALPEITEQEKQEFHRLHKIVKKGVAAFMESGRALQEIREKKLWRAGEHKTWEAYCTEVAGLSASYAKRVIHAVEIVKVLEGKPEGSAPENVPIGTNQSQVLPVSESQVRPLLLLKEPEKQKEAWEKAVDKAKGRPSASLVKEVVLEILGPEKKSAALQSKSKQNYKQQTAALIGKLRNAVSKRDDWDAVEGILGELETLIGEVEPKPAVGEAAAIEVELVEKQ